MTALRKHLFLALFSEKKREEQKTNKKVTEYFSVWKCKAMKLQLKALGFL